MLHERRHSPGLQQTDSSPDIWRRQPQNSAMRMQDDKLFGPTELPQLPSNARYVYHENRCYDWGTIGWAIQEGKVDTSQYRYLVFMNSSVRGPFLPGYFPVSLMARPVSCGHLCHAGGHSITCVRGVCPGICRLRAAKQWQAEPQPSARDHAEGMQCCFH